MAALMLTFLGWAAVVAIAGVVLTHAADQIAERTGLGHLVVGSVLLAGATSLPELSVDVTAVRSGMADLAAGDLLGSSLMNLLILAVCDLSTYLRGRMLSREAAGHSLSGLVGIALTGLVGLGLLTARTIPDSSVGPFSVPTVLIVLGYTFGIRLVFLDQRMSARRATAESESERDSKPRTVGTQDSKGRWSRLRWPLLGFLAGTVALLITGPQLAETAGRLADASGLGKTFVGTTLVALTTSLPELVASIAALRLRAFDLVVGNVFGSNAFNMVLFVVMDAFHPGPLFPGLSPTHAISCVAAVIATSIAIMGQLYRVEVRRWPVVEPDAWLVILVVGGALLLVYHGGA